MCVRICLVSSSDLANCLPQLSQVQRNGLSPLTNYTTDSTITFTKSPIHSTETTHSLNKLKTEYICKTFSLLQHTLDLYEWKAFVMFLFLSVTLLNGFASLPSVSLMDDHKVMGSNLTVGTGCSPAKQDKTVPSLLLDDKRKAAMERRWTPPSSQRWLIKKGQA